tara:strand:- start:37667 stop:38119 length:453 start_codon:yes stop_codon:yes gene_type:complete
MKKTLLIISILAVFLSCNKNKPKIGDYEATFNGSYTKNGLTVNHDRYQKVSIIDVTKTEIKLSIYQDGSLSSVLQKDKKNVSGIFFSPSSSGTGAGWFPSNEITINGEWKQNSDSYTISGNHTYLLTEYDAMNQLINEYTVTGTFEIKSK